MLVEEKLSVLIIWLLKQLFNGRIVDVLNLVDRKGYGNKDIDIIVMTIICRTFTESV